MNDDIDSGALAILVAANWDEFVEYVGNEEDADKTLSALKQDCGME